MERAIIFFCILFIPNSAKADELFGFYTGGGFNKIGAGIQLGVKLRGLKYCPIGFEATFIAPYGVEVAAPIYVVNTRRFKFHLIPPFMGLEVPIGKPPISVQWLKRSRDFNLVVGAGMEVVFPKHTFFKNRRTISFNLDWRVFVPNPIYVNYNFSDYGAVIYKQAAEEGQIWLGVTFWL